MTATATFRQTESAGLVPSKGSYGQAANTLIYGGTIVTIDGDGRADVVTNGQNACGIAVATYDNRTTAPEGGAADALTVDVAFGVHGMEYSGTAPEPQQVVYVLDNQTVTLDSNSGVRGVAGYCTELRNGLCYVYMSPAVSGEIAKMLSTSTGQGASLVGIEDAGGYYAASNVEAALAEVVTDLAAVTATNGANRIGYEDSGSKTAAATVDAALDEIYVDATGTKSIEIHLGTCADADGDFTKFVNGGADGLTWVDSKGFALRINNAGSPPVMISKFEIPSDLNSASNVTLKFLCSKSGATIGDATTILVAAYNQASGALHDADTNYGGTTNALVGNATAKTLAVLSLTLLAADLPAAGSVVSISFKATDGTLGTDDLLIFRIWVEYTAKLRTA